MATGKGHGGHHHGGVGLESRGAALDVEEPFGAHVRPEAGLGDQVVAGADADLVGQDRRVAMGDVAERTGVDQHRSVLQGLEQVGLDRLAQDRGHRPAGVEVLGRDRGAVGPVPDHDASDPGPQVGQRGGQGQDGHDLRGGRDVEAGLADHAVLPGPEPDHDVAQAAVVDVEHPPPGDLAHLEALAVPLLEMVVHQGRQQVVGRRHRMEVPGQVQVEQLHGHHLAVTATRRPPLDAEGGTHGRLAQGERGPLAQVGHGLAQADGGRGLSLAQRGGGDG
jgi:hypothetical protein